MGVWNRVFARCYDPLLARAERHGLADLRRRVLADARGRVLEIGAGTGLNLAQYPPGLELVLTEPDEPMARRLERRARGRAVVRGPADALPFADASFDTVVSTFVLCTVPDVDGALAEVRRVLRPGGRLVFLEHVRADAGSPLERWQDRLHRPWRAVACGCNSNRDLVAAIARASFDVTTVERRPSRLMPPLLRPIAYGAAPVSSATGRTASTRSASTSRPSA